MNDQEAIEVIKRLVGVSPSEKIVRAVNVAVSALEKQIPKTPVDVTGTRKGKHCPRCGSLLGEYIDDYCNSCGQALDWGEQ